MKTIFSTTLFLVLSLTSHAQGYGLEWVINPVDTLENAYHLDTEAQTTDSEGNLIIVGNIMFAADFDPSAAEYELSSHGSNYDPFLAKYDSLGNLLWAKVIGGYESERITSVTVDLYDNILMTGTFSYRFHYDADVDSTFFSVPGTNGYPDHGFVLKYDGNGDMLWVKVIASTWDLKTEEIAMDNDNNIILTGTYRGDAHFMSPNYTDTISSIGGWDSFLAKLDSVGNLIWVNSFGNNEDCEGQEIAIDAQNNIYLSGIFMDTLDMDPSAGVSEIINPTTLGCSFLVKYDGTGTHQWSYSLPHLGGVVFARDITIDESNNLTVTGEYRNLSTSSIDFDPGPGVVNLAGSSGYEYPFVEKFSPSGQHMWAQTFANLRYFSKYVQVDDLGTIYLAGEYESNSFGFHPFIARCDNMGNEVYTNLMPGDDDNIVAGLSLYDGVNPIISGYFDGTTDFDPSAAVLPITTPYFAPSNATLSFVARYNAGGSVLNAFPVGNNTCLGSGPSVMDDVGRCIAPDLADNILVSGRYEGSLDFDPSPAEAILEGTPFGYGSSTTFFMAKYTSTGDYQWAFKLDSISSDGCNCFVVDSSNAFYTSGILQGTTDFDPSAGTSILSTTYTSGFLAKYDENSNLIWNFQLGNNTPASNSRILTMDLDSAGNIVVAGSFSGTVDFDQVPGVATYTSNTFGQVFFAKYDSNGNLLWIQFLENVSMQHIDMDIGSDDAIFLTGRYAGIGDFDPSPAVYTLTSVSSADIFVARYDNVGNFEWAFGMGSSSIDVGQEIEAGEEHVYVTGYYSNTVDFDPSPATYELTSSSKAMYIGRYDASNGELDWVFDLSSNGFDPHGLEIDENENIAVSGVYGEIISWSGNPTYVDFDPSPTGVATHPMGAFNSRANFVALYDSTGAYIWSATTEGFSSSFSEGNLYFDSTHLLVTGQFEYNTDFTPSPVTNHITSLNGSDVFIANYVGCTPTLGTETASSCGSYAWGGNVYTTSGVYFDTAYMANGCDSIIELTLTIFPVDTVSTTVTECNSYTWTNGTTYTSSGTYYEVLQSVSGCDSVHELILTIDANTPVAAVINDTTLETQNTGISYQWLDCSTQSIIPGATTPTYTPGYNGSFAVIVDDGTCADTSACVDILVNSIQSLSGSSLTLYPNPTHDKFTVEFDDVQGSFDVIVSDLSGRILISETYANCSSANLNLTANNGTYWVQVTDANGQISTFKVIKY